jgi:hypothetical protein
MTVCMVCGKERHTIEEEKACFNVFYMIDVPAVSLRKLRKNKKYLLGLDAAMKQANAQPSFDPFPERKKYSGPST